MANTRKMPPYEELIVEYDFLKNPKHVTYSAKCKDCGEETLLEKLKPAHLECDNCGDAYNYLTNIRSREFTYECNSCGSPVEMEFNFKKMRYHTLGHNPIIKRRKRGK